MGKYFINEVKCGTIEGVGPFPGIVNVSVNVTDDGKSFWISNSEFDGVPNFYVTDEDIFDRLGQDDDIELDEFLNDHFVDEFDGVVLGDYDDIFSSIEEDADNPAAALIRYIILLTRCENEDVDKIIAMAKGKYVDELDIPKSDVEMEFEEEL